MGYVKNYFVPEASEYNEEYFYLGEDEYIENLAALNEFEQEEIEHEYDLADLNRCIYLIKERAAELDIACDEAVAALSDFINRYESAIGID